MLVLAHLRCGNTYAPFAAGFCIGIATAYGYLREAGDLLSAFVPPLDQVRP
nr:transposase family protein [Streptomyces sp. CB02366]